MTKQAGAIVPEPAKIGRPKGSPNKRTVLRLALADTFADGEAGYWQAVCSQAKGGCTQSQALIANRLMPTLKPQSEVVTLPEPLQGTSAEMARQLVQMAGRGEIAPSTVQELISALADCIKIETGDDLLKRIELLEAGA